MHVQLTCKPLLCSVGALLHTTHIAVIPQHGPPGKKMLPELNRMVDDPGRPVKRTERAGFSCGQRILALLPQRRRRQFLSASQPPRKQARCMHTHSLQRMPTSVSSVAICLCQKASCSAVSPSLRDGELAISSLDNSGRSLSQPPAVSNFCHLSASMAAEGALQRSAEGLHAPKRQAAAAPDAEGGSLYKRSTVGSRTRWYT